MSLFIILFSSINAARFSSNDKYYVTRAMSVIRLVVSEYLNIYI
jgi:hypothetical protein